MEFAREIQAACLVWLTLAAPVAAAAAALAYWLWRRRRLALPPGRGYAVPWQGWEMLGVAALSLGVWEEVCRGPAELLLGGSAGPLLTGSVAFCLATPLYVGSVLLLLRLCSGTRPYQLGVHCHRPLQMALLGCVAWLAGTPLVYAVNIGMNWLHLEMTRHLPTPHDLTKLVQADDPALGAALLLLMATVLAPLREEFLFRGVVLRWAGGAAWRGHAVFAAALVLPALGVLARLFPPPDAPEPPGDEYVVATLVFIAALVPVYLFVPPLFRSRRPAPREDTPPPDALPEPIAVKPAPGWLTRWADAATDPARQDRRANRVRALVASAALFATVHPWPTPVPLFILGLILGWLVDRTQSLLPAVVLHALFNALACVLVFQSMVR